MTKKTFGALTTTTRTKNAFGKNGKSMRENRSKM